MTSTFETVHYLEECYPQLSEGIADYLGAPHYFRRIDDHPWPPPSWDEFELYPISQKVLAAALEVSEILGRWLEVTQPSGGLPNSIDEFGALPAERDRRRELRNFLEASYAAATKAGRVLVRGEFHLCPASPSGFQVRWTTAI